VRKDEGSEGFSFDRDYPASLTYRSSSATTIRLDFVLSDVEVAEFLDATGIRTNGKLPIKITLGQRAATLGVLKQGKGSASHAEKSLEIARFISSRIGLLYIPAVRTPDRAIQLIRNLAVLKFREMAGQSEYLKLSNQLASLRSKALTELGGELATEMSLYVPSIVDVQLISDDIDAPVQVDDVLIDDGVPTSIRAKGDGVKSLLTMALMQLLARSRDTQRTWLLAMEEPEAHLHPDAIHEVKGLISQIAQDQQVIVSTHSPVLISRDAIASNVLVDNNHAKPARSMRELRESLGVQVGDNLSSAEVAVVVEGSTDARVLSRLLSDMNPRIARAISDGRLIFHPSHGASGIHHHCRMMVSLLCLVIAVADNDDPGRAALAKVSGLDIADPQFRFSISLAGMRNSELEDLLVPASYIEGVGKVLGRPIEPTRFKARSRRWSDAIRHACSELGVAASDELVAAAKEAVASSVEASDAPSEAVKQECKALMESLAEKVELLLAPRA
jgi:predicted ATPase